MQYDPIKQSLGKVFNRSPWLRKVFYLLLNILLLRSWYVRREIRRFARQSAGRKNVLDAGSGFGQYSWFMARIATEWTITGIDIKPEQISDCQNFFNRCGLGNRVSFREADLVHLTDQDNYDLIITIDVMEHIAEDEQVFRNFFRAMKKNSLLLFQPLPTREEVMLTIRMILPLLTNTCETVTALKKSRPNFTPQAFPAYMHCIPMVPPAI